MAIVFQSWLNSNSQRNYPLHDVASRRGDGGILPNSFLTDLHVYIPGSAGHNAYVAAAAVSEKLVTLILAACDESLCSSSSSAPSTTILASVSLVKPVVPYRNYALETVYPGVAGWVSFGSAVQDKLFSIKFDNPRESLLLERCTYSLEEPPVETLAKPYVEPLTGLIRLKGRPGSITIQRKTMIVNGVDKEVIAVGVDTSVGNPTTILQDLAGVCGHRPQALNCNKRVITAINGVTPDCNGNIDLEFAGGIIVGEVTNGLILDFPLGLHDVCTKISPSEVPNEPSDECGSMAPIPDPP